MPVYWDDNYVTLLPGEEKVFEARYLLSDSHGSKPVVEVSGWNVKKIALE